MSGMNFVKLNINIYKFLFNQHYVGENSIQYFIFSQGEISLAEWTKKDNMHGNIIRLNIIV